MITVTQTSVQRAFNATSYLDVLSELPPIQTPVIPFTKTKQIIHFEPKTTEAPKEKDSQKLVARKKLPTTRHESPNSSKPKRKRSKSPKDSTTAASTSERPEVVEPTAASPESEFIARGTQRRQAFKQAEVQLRTAAERSNSPQSSSASTSRVNSPNKKRVVHRQSDEAATISSSSESSDLSDTDVAKAQESMKKSKRMYKIKTHKLKSSTSAPPSRMRQEHSSPSMSEEPDAEASSQQTQKKKEAEIIQDIRWRDISMSVAVPGRRDEIKRVTGIKHPAVVFKARELAGRVDAIWTAFDHGAAVYFAPELEPVVRQARDVVAYLAQLPNADDRRAFRSFLAEAQWKIVACIPRELYKTYGTRIATPIERVAYNFMQHLPKEIVPMERLKEKARKDIGETAKWIDFSDSNVLTFRDIWTRIMHELEGLDDIDHRLLELAIATDQEFTIIVSTGLPNTCAVFKLLNEYSKEAANLIGNIYLIELSDGGLYGLSSLARNLLSWRFGLEDLVYAALDIDNSQRSARLSVHQPSRDTTGDLQIYLGCQPYDPQVDIHFVECSCNPEVRRIFLETKMTTALGCAVNK